MNELQIRKKKIVEDQIYAALEIKRIQNALPSSLLKDRFVKLAMREIVQNDKLMECTPLSLAAAILEAATYGLEISQFGMAYLVPFKVKDQDLVIARLILGYKGLITLAYRTKRVQQIYAAAVYEKDEFDYELGLTPNIKHKPFFGLEAERGRLIGAYAVAKMKDVEPQFVVISRQEIKMARDQSKSGLWGKYPDEMAKKTAVRRLCKMLPFDSAEWQDAYTVDTQGELGENQSFRSQDIVDVESAPTAETVQTTQTRSAQALNNILRAQSAQAQPAPQQPQAEQTKSQNQPEPQAQTQTQAQAKPQTQEQAQAATEEAPAKETKAKPKSKVKAQKQEPAIPATPEAIEPIEEQPPTDVPAKQVNEAVNAASPSYNIHDKYEDLIDSLGANEYSGYITSIYAKEHQTTVELSKAYFCEHPRELAMIVENLRQSHPQPQ